MLLRPGMLSQHESTYIVTTLCLLFFSLYPRLFEYCVQFFVFHFLFCVFFRELLSLAGIASLKHFCSQCFQKLENMKNFSRRWEPDHLKTKEEAKACGEGWRAQTSFAARKEHLKDHGFRYTCLHDLPYFDLIKDHAFDLFHNILEGVFESHT